MISQKEKELQATDQTIETQRSVSQPSSSLLSLFNFLNKCKKRKKEEI
jgi:hypothetical protein